MIDQELLNYKRIEKAIHYIHENFKSQPSLNEIAAAVNLSPFHFQRLFSDWAGVSPKKFIQYISLQHAKALLGTRQATLFDAAYETGFSSTSRLHDLFINIEGMTPGEFKNDGANLKINYSFASTPFGQIIMASTEKGLCHIAFDEHKEQALNMLKGRFAHAQYRQGTDQFQKDALSIFQKNWRHLNEIKLHLRGTPFQLKVWESLLKIPYGQLTTYGAIAKEIGNPKSSRAVGTAIGNNPIAYLIPCHRVIQSSGNIGGYMWGPIRKSAMIGWEAAQKNR